jgi:hypothetical protein
MGRVPAAAPAKGAPAPRDEIQEAVDKFVESASKSERIISEVWPASLFLMYELIRSATMPTL